MRYCNVRMVTKNFLYTENKTAKLENNCEIHDVIGPPDPISNLRPVVFASSIKETHLEKRYREFRKETQQWNQIFWSKHNTNFIEERNQFQQLLKVQGRKTLTADDMSVFYKLFLDKNWQSHFDYNITWYKKNIKILFFGIAAKISKLTFK
ncbi:PREDICTED: APOPT family protein CG14806, mitochondrial isoform X2 [Cyphomyrmex costatus]|uniref:APOPT family protein CG14806, mitochondrial isoform X2 n=1 Tax=Cyphomyrmex costatus TaxID=456900 RepID=UPI0008522FEF|nr:PREDICTED: APOPT family protein CG14806, mitochondrial isoform X2 [Cyphomyrmex costatus]